MPEAIDSYCDDTQQAPPVSVASYVRTILESLALKYRHTLDGLREVYPRPINKLHIIGGGVKNQLLCQYAANATGLPVIAGPDEATAAGNLLVQAMATGELSSLEEIRECERRSFNPAHYEPQDTKLWEEQYQKFLTLINKT
jgi:rhamnulokinase